MAPFDQPAQYPEAAQAPYDNVPATEATAAQPYPNDPSASQPYATMQSFVSTQEPYQPSLPQTEYIPEPVQPASPEMAQQEPQPAISASEGTEGTKKEQASELRARLEWVSVQRDM